MKTKRRRLVNSRPGKTEEVKEIIIIDDSDEEALPSKSHKGPIKSTRDLIDRKGKRPASSKAEPVQNSGAVHSKKFFCKICMEPAPKTHIFTINPCKHLFCNACMIQYITSKIEQNVAVIPCPELGCKSRSIDPLICQPILPASTFDKWGLIMCESTLGQNKFYCPFKGCSALLVDEGEVDVTNSECPHCNRMFCAKCKVPWHAEMSCEEFQRLGEDERGRDDRMLIKLAKQKKWQRCRQCSMYVEKTEGCLFMKCRCGFCFCYACGTKMSKQTHYCTKCKR